MLSTYPGAWLLLCLPFLSSLVLRSVPCLWRLASALNWFTWPLGVLGLACLFAGLFALIPPPFALPMAIAGGAVSGYVVFSVPRRGSGSDGDDWRRPGPPPDEPPEPPFEGAPIDWDLFDRLRGQWERRAVARR
jgi:hypothetical protein